MTNQPKLGIGIELNKNTPKILFLMFTDGCIIFCRTTKRAARNIRQTLDYYYTVSGQLINYQTSCLLFLF